MEAIYLRVIHTRRIHTLNHALILSLTHSFSYHEGHALFWSPLEITWSFSQSQFISFIPSILPPICHSYLLQAVQGAGRGLVVRTLVVEPLADGVHQQREPRDALHRERQERLDREVLTHGSHLQGRQRLSERRVLLPAQRDREPSKQELLSVSTRASCVHSATKIHRRNCVWQQTQNLTQGHVPLVGLEQIPEGSEKSTVSEL